MYVKLQKKLLLVSKYALLGLFGQCLLISVLLANTGNAQSASIEEVRISILQDNISVEDVFQKIEEKTNFRFAYRKGIIDGGQRIGQVTQFATLGELLRHVSKSAGLDFRRVDEIIHVRKSRDGVGTTTEVLVSQPKQEQTVTGKIVSQEDNEGLPGVNVIVKGTTTGTVTDLEGNYSIAIPGPESTLVFSSIGYIKEEVVVGNRTVVDYAMVPDITALDEIVVVGYGTVKKGDLISSISQVGAETIKQSTTPTFATALQGTTSGVQVASSGGEPNAATRILIRGVSSITSATEPLIIVDGLVVSSGGTNPLTYINPQDIENISVLKDASATAIYGSRGANGVILITTKSGTVGKKELNFSVETGVTVPINELELANADEYRSLVALARSNSGLTEEFDLGRFLVDQRHVQRFDDLDIYNTTNTDWVDLMQQNGRINQYTLSASNATENTSYYMSGQYRGQDGNFVGTRFERYTGRLNLDFKATDYLKVGVKYSFIHNNDKPRERFQGNIDFVDRVNNNGRRPTFGSLYGGALPVYPEVWPDDNSPFDPLAGYNLTYLDRDDVSVRTFSETRNMGVAYMELNPIKGLTLRGEFAGNYRTDREKNFSAARPEEFLSTDLSLDDRFLLDYIYDTGVPRIVNYYGSNWNYNYNLTASYNKSISDKHNLNALVGFERVFDAGRDMYLDLENAGSPVDPTEVDFNVRDGEQLLEIRNLVAGETRFQSVFGRLSYNFDNRYYFSGTMRQDGSSRFSPGDRYSVFPSLAGGWIVSDESFWDVPVLNYLKVRSSWGITGNANIPDFQFFDGFSTWPNYPDRTGAWTLNSLGSKTIQWEKTETFDFGLEMGFFQNRISASFAYYQGKTTDLLLFFPAAPSIGIGYLDRNYPSALDNVGSMTNHGIELEINSININTNNLRWETSLNFTTNRNKVESLYPGFDGDPRQLSFGGVTSVLEGAPVGQFFLPSYAGLDESGNVLIREIDQDLRVDGIYEFTGNIIRNTGQAANDHSIPLEGKTGMPTWFGGLSNTLSYKGFTLNVLFTFQGGHYIYDNVGNERVGIGRGVLRKDLVNNSWTPDNTNAKYPVLMWNNVENNPDDGVTDNLSLKSDNLLEKGDLLRLRNISLRYDFPQSAIEKMKIVKGIGLYINMENVATFSKFNVVDPEFITGGDAAARNIGQGVVNGVPYWTVFTTMAGVNITF
jgi:TonB-linked SusC/RagA family outer membrane protein